MLSHNDFKKGIRFILNGQPYEVLEVFPQRYAQRKLMIQTKIKNLITNNVLDKTIHQGEIFKEAEISKIKVKFLYSHRGAFFFSELENPDRRFDLNQEQIGKSAEFLKPNEIIEGIEFQEKMGERVINISLPIKVQLKVVDAPPGIKGDRAQGGTKIVTLETGAKINAPLFIEAGDIVEVNTETGEYVRRVF